MASLKYLHLLHWEKNIQINKYSLSKPPMTYKNVILDIEGTVCPISFVKNQLFPFFLDQLPAKLDKYSFPLTEENSDDSVSSILVQFPSNVLGSKETLLGHIRTLVANDIKDPVLKQLQGFIWEQGYTTGSILAPLYPDAIQSMHRWAENGTKIYIYSSGSIKAQKLLFGNVQNDTGSIDLNDLITDYFDTTNAGKKTEKSSYKYIINSIGASPASTCLFLSDNPLEVEAALQAGLQSVIVVKHGNYPLSCEDKSKYKVVTDLLDV